MDLSAGQQFSGQQSLFNDVAQKSEPQMEDPSHLRGDQIPGQRMLDVNNRGFNRGYDINQGGPSRDEPLLTDVVGPKANLHEIVAARQFNPGKKTHPVLQYAEVTPHGYHYDTTTPISTYRQYGVISQDASSHKKWGKTQSRTFGPNHPLFTAQREEETMMSGQGYIDRMRDNTENLPEPWIGRYEGRDIIFDGHHRISAFRHAGEGSFKGKFRDLDAEESAAQPLNPTYDDPYAEPTDDDIFGMSVSDEDDSFSDPYDPNYHDPYWGEEYSGSEDYSGSSASRPATLYPTAGWGRRQEDGHEAAHVMPGGVVGREAHLRSSEDVGAAPKKSPTAWQGSEETPSRWRSRIRKQYEGE